MNQDRQLREHLAKVLDSQAAHVTFSQALDGLSAEMRGRRAEGTRHTIWELLEHMRIAQWDILEFSRNGDHVSPDFPAGYWPSSSKPEDEEGWQQSVNQFKADLKAMKELVEDPSTDLFSPIPHGEGQTILREALLVVDHNAYHLGQIVLVRSLLGAWPG